MIDITKQYRTRDGREVRIYATDGNDPFAIHGAIVTEKGWAQTDWTKEGGYILNVSHQFDLIEVRPRHKRVVWLNVYEGVSTSAWEEKKWADKYAEPNRIACLRVELDFAEGDGL